MLSLLEIGLITGILWENLSEHIFTPDFCAGGTGFSVAQI